MEEETKKRVEKLIEKLAIEEKQKQVRLLEAESMKPDFWQDHQAAGKKMKELSDLQKEIEEAAFLSELVKEGEFKEAAKLLEKMENLLYLSGPDDENPAIVSIHAGKGGHMKRLKKYMVKKRVSKV